MSSDIVAEAIFRQHTPITEKPINMYHGIFTKESQSTEEAFSLCIYYAHCSFSFDKVTPTLIFRVSN